MNCHLPKPVARLAVLLAVVLTSAESSVLLADERLDFFENHIRPVLIEHCYHCHSSEAKNVRGGLLLDSQNGWKTGGDSGPAIVAGSPDNSLLMSSLRHESFEMPPDKLLPAETIQHFEQWIRDGAVDPREGRALARESMDLVNGRTFWSFQPVAEVQPPTIKSEWAKTPIDSFIAAHHQQNDLATGSDATAHQVLRRLYFALVGLPPLPKDLQRFEKSVVERPGRRDGRSHRRAAFVSSLWRTMGKTLAGRRPICGIQRWRKKLDVPACMAVPRLCDQII